MQAERLNAIAHTSAILGAERSIFEGGRAFGVYTAQFKRAKPEHEREHRDLVERRLAPLSKLLRAPAGTITWRERVEFMRESAEIEAHLQTLAEIEREDVFPNVVTTVGKNFLLDNGLAGSAYTAAFFMLLIGAVSYTTGPAAGDTAASHGGWTEAGATNAPTYSGSRKTPSWNSASGGSKALSAGLVFTFTGSGTAKGAGMSTVSTVDSTSGTLLSAGLFTGGDQPVVSTNTLTVSWSLAL